MLIFIEKPYKLTYDDVIVLHIFYGIELKFFKPISLDNVLNITNLTY